MKVMLKASLAVVMASIGVTAAQAGDLTIESWRVDDKALWEKEVIPAFNKAHPDINVKFAPTAPTEYNASLNTRLAGGTAGDFDISGGGGSGGSGDDAPAVSNVQLVTPLQANVETTVSYTYTDNETDPEGQSTIAAYQADDALGTNSSQIISGTDTEITPPLSSENKFIRIGVTPIATSGTTPGVEVFSNWEGPVSPAPFQSVNGLVVIKSTSATTAPGTGTFSSKVWTLESGTDGTNQYYTALANSGNSTGDSLVGPRIDHDINFTETGTYRVYLRMNGPSGSDDSVHVSIDNDPLTFGRYGLSRSGWGWISTVNGRPGPDEVEFTITSPGVKTVSVWMREDGVRYDCMVLKHITLQGTANLSSSPCPAETGV